MKTDILITEILNSNQMGELIDIFNKTVRPKKEGRNDFTSDSNQTE